MLVTDPAYREMEAQSGRLTTRLWLLLRHLTGRGAGAPLVDGAYRQRAEHRAHLRLVSLQSPQSPAQHEEGDIIKPDFKWRRHPLLRERSAVSDSSAKRDPDLRTARSAAVRGIFFARSQRHAEAEAAFSEAAGHADLDLDTIPGFWDLSRAGMNAAVHAYETNERYRDASALAARIRVTYRPRSVAPLEPPMPDRRRIAGG